MEPRDVFDGALVVLITIVVYIEVIGFGFSGERLEAVLDALLGQDLAIYLVVAGMAGVAFVGYITIYLPQKYSRRGAEPPQ